jgi:hypothetical protein
MNWFMSLLELSNSLKDVKRLWLCPGDCCLAQPTDQTKKEDLISGQATVE